MRTLAQPDVCVTTPLARSARVGQPAGMVDQVDVVVVGAGLAGLRAAQLLSAAGREVVVLEAADGIGGRVRTDRVDGYTLDRGFQLYNPAYPEGRLAWPGLAVRAFEPGVAVMTDGRVHSFTDPRRDVRSLGSTVRSVTGLGLTRGVAALAAYVARLGTAARPRENPADQDQPIGQALTRAGVDQKTLDVLVRPFLSGALADPTLTSPRWIADEILRSFRSGTPGVPDQGMDELPRRLAAGLAITCGVAVTSVAEGRVVSPEGQWRARDVVLAVGNPGAVLPGAPHVSWRALTSWYFACGPLPRRHRMLLVAPGTRLANVAVISDVAPAYAPEGRTLVVASAVGHHDDSESVEWVRRETAGLLDVAPAELELIARYAIKEALPAFEERRAASVSNGVVIAGDHRTTPSINGALASGRRAAELLLG